MIRSCRFRTVLAVVALLALILPSAGCGLFSRSKEKAPDASPPANPPAPVATPAPPPPPRRPADARVADEESLRHLIQGRTTKVEVRDLFGIPQEIVIAPGTETFIYYRDRTSGWLFRTTERVEMLTVRFDLQGVLKDFEYRFAGR